MSEVCKETETEPNLTPLSGEELQGRTSNSSNEARIDIMKCEKFLEMRATGIFRLEGFRTQRPSL